VGRDEALTDQRGIRSSVVQPATMAITPITRTTTARQPVHPHTPWPNWAKGSVLLKVLRGNFTRS